MNQQTFSLCLAALSAMDIDDKLEKTLALAVLGGIDEGLDAADIPDTIVVGWPSKPNIALPSAAPKRGFGTVLARVHLMHAIAHIEFNAINLALDALCRFPNMPSAYYQDWLRVAVEEAEHFALVRAYLRKHGYDYGDFDAHGSLWEMAENSADDVLHRMAFAPRLHEARGLDVTPMMIQRLKQAKDEAAVAVLEVILREEIGHVAIGSRWFAFVCAQRGLDTETCFRELIHQRYPHGLPGPLNIEARLQAGFSQQELQGLQAKS